ncbi:MAG: aspartate aminotransferase family protein, partial [Candidatus Omnitrophica bacterium]|nr:aspartate aminotransferase family protein [Candidatus Omnitrophota bacterium]
TELFHSYDILAYLGFTRRNLIVFSPSLIIEKEELDKAVDAIDKVLSSGWLTLGKKFISRYI